MKSFHHPSKLQLDEMMTSSLGRRQTQPELLVYSLESSHWLKWTGLVKYYLLVYRRENPLLLLFVRKEDQFSRIFPHNHALKGSVHHQRLDSPILLQCHILLQLFAYWYRRRWVAHFSRLKLLSYHPGLLLGLVVLIGLFSSQTNSCPSWVRIFQGQIHWSLEILICMQLLCILNFQTRPRKHLDI